MYLAKGTFVINAYSFKLKEEFKNMNEERKVEECLEDFILDLVEYDMAVKNISFLYQLIKKETNTENVKIEAVIDNTN